VNIVKIVYITEFFSEKMGYSENCLPKAIASLGQEVHVVASELQAYGNLPNYDESYGRFLGPRRQPCGIKFVDGYTLHRLPHRLYSGYVDICGLLSKLRALKPDIVQTINCISTNTLKIAVAQRLFGYNMFTECHQHMSIIKPYLRYQTLLHPKRLLYFVTRTIPGRFVSLFTKKCFPIAPDCVEVAHRFYGVQKRKIKIMTLGTDTDLFYPVRDKTSMDQRIKLRRELGFSKSEIVCIYTGRFSEGKNPLLLAKAVSEIRKQGLPYRAMFIGDGFQRTEIELFEGNVLIPFVDFSELPKYYRAADIGVWPRQESMAMLDATSCGIPVVVSDHIGDLDRVRGNGEVYSEGEVRELVRVLRNLDSKDVRCKYGEKGRQKMVDKYSWVEIAKDRLMDYAQALERRT
jgi:glycosyltransferase involved in cell wall biosynthesis